MLFIKKHETLFFKKEEITLPCEFIFVFFYPVFHWLDIVKKALPKVRGSEKKIKNNFFSIFISGYLGVLQVNFGGKLHSTNANQTYNDVGHHKTWLRASVT